MFVGSRQTGLKFGPTCEASPLENESFFEPDWELPLTADVQHILFNRTLIHFNNITQCVPVSLKRKYRLRGEDLVSLRCTIAFWSQLRFHLSLGLIN